MPLCEQSLVNVDALWQLSSEDIINGKEIIFQVVTIERSVIIALTFCNFMCLHLSEMIKHAQVTDGPNRLLLESNCL